MERRGVGAEAPTQRGAVAGAIPPEADEPLPNGAARKR
jgi:hypothetical protein